MLIETKEQGIQVLENCVRSCHRKHPRGISYSFLRKNDPKKSFRKNNTSPYLKYETRFPVCFAEMYKNYTGGQWETFALQLATSRFIPNNTAIVKCPEVQEFYKDLLNPKVSLYKDLVKEAEIYPIYSEDTNSDHYGDIIGLVVPNTDVNSQLLTNFLLCTRQLFEMCEWPLLYYDCKKAGMSHIQALYLSMFFFKSGSSNIIHTSYRYCAHGSWCRASTDFNKLLSRKPTLTRTEKFKDFKAELRCNDIWNNSVVRTIAECIKKKFEGKKDRYGTIQMKNDIRIDEFLRVVREVFEEHKYVNLMRRKHY